MDLRDALVKQKPRERSGSKSSNRFDFQKDWALLKLLELHEHALDYLLVLDYHDDILILDSEMNPSEMDFYQIKTKESGNWTLPRLTTAKKDRDGGYLLSIAGKMYDCKLKFPTNEVQLNFVSNAIFSLNLEDPSENSKSKKRICLTELQSSEIEKMCKALMSEHKLSTDPDFAAISFLHVTDLTITGHDKYTKGELIEFLERMYPDGKFRPGAIYRTIFDEIKRKTSYEWEVSDYADILKHKAISKREFQKLLDNSIGIGTDLDDVWAMVESRLQIERVPFFILQRLKENWRKTELAMMDPTNNYFHEVRKHIASLSQPFWESESTLYSTINEVYRQYRESGVQYIYDEYEIKTMILMELTVHE